MQYDKKTLELLIEYLIVPDWPRSAVRANNASTFAWRDVFGFVGLIARDEFVGGSVRRFTIHACVFFKHGIDI